MRKVIFLLACMGLLSSCYTASMKGSPAAVAAGSSIGGVLGSIELAGITVPSSEHCLELLQVLP